MRTPLLVNGWRERASVSRSSRCSTSISPAFARSATSRAPGGPARLTLHAVASSAIEGAAFVITSIRVGGIEARIHDEQAALALGLVGQETVGPGGFAMAVRTIPPLLAHVRDVMTTRRTPG